jgi:hypothetical protein
MNIWKNWNLRTVAFGALSAASATGCAASVTDEQEATIATTGETLTLTASGAYLWKTGDSPKIMGSSASTFCFLTEVYGSFRAAGDKVEIVDNGANWILHGEVAASTARKPAAAARCISKPNPNRTILHWPRKFSNGTPDWRSFTLQPATTNACYLTGLGGSFLSSSDYVQTAINSANEWVLEGRTSMQNMHVDAACVPNVTLISDHNDVLSEGQHYRGMLPFNYNQLATGPVGCFLTEVGGALGGSVSTQPSLYTRLVVTELPDATLPNRWYWDISVNQPGLGARAGTRCIQ